jgi:predicted nucleotidyltransferase
VEGLYLFGSYARDEADEGSDVDVFVDPASNRDFDFLSFMEGSEALQNACKPQRRNRLCRVEIGYSNRSGLSPYIRKNVECEALRIF